MSQMLGRAWMLGDCCSLPQQESGLPLPGHVLHSQLTAQEKPSAEVFQSRLNCAFYFG